MGCVGTREDLIPVERAIIEAERKLKFNLSKSAYVDAILRKYSSRNLISPEQLKEVTEHLSIAKEPTEREAAFYKLFKAGDDYDLKQMVLLGVLLSRGEATTKARLYFQAFDATARSALSHSEVRDMFAQLLDISISRLPLLVQETDCTYLRLGEVAQHIRLLGDEKERAAGVIAQRICGESLDVPIEDFVKRFEIELLGELVNPFGLRTFSRKLSLQSN